MTLLDSTLDKAVRRLMNLMVTNKWDEVAASVGALAPGRLEAFARELHDYFATFEPIPEAVDPFRYLIVQNDGRIWLSMRFWSKEEGASDLELAVIVEPESDTAWSLQLEDIHVP